FGPMGLFAMAKDADGVAHLNGSVSQESDSSGRNGSGPGQDPRKAAEVSAKAELESAGRARESVSEPVAVLRRLVGSLARHRTGAGVRQGRGGLDPIGADGAG